MVELHRGGGGRLHQQLGFDFRHRVPVPVPVPVIDPVFCKKKIPYFSKKMILFFGEKIFSFFFKRKNIISFMFWTCSGYLPVNKCAIAIAIAKCH
jgi:hypothetical protein